MIGNKSLYEELCTAWHKAHSSSSGMKRTLDLNAFWNQNKEDHNIIQNKIADLKNTLKKRQISVSEYFSRSQSLSTLPAQTASQSVVIDLTPSQNRNPKKARRNNNEEVGYPAAEGKAQVESKNKIDALNARLFSLQQVKSSGLATNEQINELKNNLDELNNEKKKLKRLQQNQQRQKEFRDKRKASLLLLKNNEPEVYDRVVAAGIHPGTRGKPPLEVRQPLLLETIVDIVTMSAAADQRRSCEVLRTCQTVDDLHTALLERGFQLSRSAVYLRLLPRRTDTREGKRHVSTFPVRLLRATNDGRSHHEDSHFCAATMKFLRNLAELLGPDCVFMLSQDDKARVPFGIPSVAKQAPILMHLSYKVRLLDHDFPKGSKHKLIPSIYAGLAFDAKKKLTYSGPTYAAIRSGKHDKSCSESHSVDFRRLLTLKNFESLIKINGSPKPVMIIFTDGGPDENPRFEGTLNQMVKHFKEFNLDAIFVSCYAPGQSAFNPVERRMAPLSKDLAGIILPHDYYGTHLEGTRTVNRELEIHNFQKAGSCLAEIWTEAVIDNYEVFAEYINPVEGYPSQDRADEKWIFKHVRQSQYCLQIIKCSDVTCCGVIQTNIKSILQNKFLPAPVPFHYTAAGIQPCPQDEKNCGTFLDLASRIVLQNVSPLNDRILPFDYFCPSTKSKIGERTCPVCQAYFPSKKSVGTHRKIVHKSSIEDIEETINRVVAAYTTNEAESDEIEVIEDLIQWCTTPFVECDEENVEF